MSIGEALTSARGKLEAAGISSGRLDAELLLSHVLSRPREWILAHGDEELGASEQNRFDELAARRAKREPLVHLTNRREFYGLEFEITPDVLTPRVETEQMVEWAANYVPEGGRVIDIGTGSGAIAIALKTHRPDLSVTATEISPPALQVARRNAERHGADISFMLADIWTPLQVPSSQSGSGIEGTLLASEPFDAVLTNLPYLKDEAREELMEEVRHEPDVALFGGPDGLDLYRRMLAGLPDRLRAGGFLFTECDPWQQEDLIAEAARVGLAALEQSYFILGFKRK